MPYRISPDEKLVTAVKKVFKRYRTVSSQYKLKRLVEKEMQTKTKHFKVSETRLRTLVITQGLAHVEIHTREGDPNKVLNHCPVCSGSLQRIKNTTIYGGEVTLEYRCARCGYWTGKKKKVPTLYVFHAK